MPGQPDIIPVILAGGEGRRLWPLSRPLRPKPFIRIAAGPSFLQATAARAAPWRAPVIVCNGRHRELVEQQMRNSENPPAQVFMEPQGRGTAPAVAVVAHYFAKENPLFLVMPSDHAIANPARLEEAVDQGVSLARQGQIVLFGVKPRKPANDFGYIRCENPISANIFAASDFIEKPDKETARRLVRENWLWNSGLFLFSAQTFLTKLRALDPAFHDSSYQAVARASRLRNAIYLEESAFGACPALSLDRAIIEKTAEKAVIPVDMGWTDLGSWAGLFRHFLLPGER